jgi:hypothetical protein
MIAWEGNTIYTSIDGGASWTARYPDGAGNRSWEGVASDSDGSFLIASKENTTGLFISTDSGVTWIERIPDAWAATGSYQVACDSDGSHIIVSHNSTTFTSQDYGVSWITEDISGLGAGGVASDDDGSNLIAGNVTGRLYTKAGTTLYSEASWAETVLTSAGRAILDDATAADQATTLGLGTGDSPEFTGLTLSGLTDDSYIYPSSGVLTSLGVASHGQLPIGSTGTTPVLATLSGTTDHISVANGAGSITLDLDTNTQILLGSFNGIFLEKLDFTISVADSTVTGSLEQDGGGDLTQKFSDGYTTLDCTDPVLTIDLTAYVGTNAVPKVVFVYILQSAKTVMAASNSDWPATEHIKIARLILQSVVTVGTVGGALGNQNWNDYAFDASGEGHILDVEHRLRQEPAQYESGVALTLKNSAGAALTTGNSSTAVEIVTAEGKIFQLHRHTFPAFDMYSSGDDAHIANQVVDEGGAYSITEDLVTDITRYVDGSDAGAAIGTNKYFNLVIWGIINREGEVSHLMINLPTGQYTTSANAVADIDGTSTYDIPLAFKGTGFLVARLTFRKIGGAQWTYIAQEDLRGQTPVVSAGVGVSTTDHALLANLTAPADDHTQYLLASGSRALAGAWDMGSQALTNVNIDSGDIHNDVTHTQWDAAYSHSLSTSGNPHSVTPTELSLVIGTNTQAFSAALDDLTNVGVVTGDSYFLVGTGAGTLAWETTTTVRTSIGLGTGDSPQFTGIELGHASDTTLTRVSAGVIAVEGTTVMLVGDAPTAHTIASHSDTTGTGAELNTLTDGSETALHSHAGGADTEKVKVDVGATADYIGAANSDGVLRTTTGLSYVDGGNFVTLGLSFLGLEALTDPGNDRLLFWDDSESAFKWNSPSTGLSIDATSLGLNFGALGEETTPDVLDVVCIYDPTGGAHHKVQLSNLKALSAYTDEDSNTDVMLKDHAYKAATDGLVYVYILTGAAGTSLKGYVGLTNDPAGAGTLIQPINIPVLNYDVPINFAVAKDEYFEVTTSSTPVILWKSIGTLLKPVDQD